ncbi:head completion/stabilization protein, partial [Xanthomonas oryzae pv. oryzae]
YLRAVACATAVEVTERYRSFDATNSANQRADDLTPSITELRRDQRWAVRDLQNLPRSTVELI